MYQFSNLLNNKKINFLFYKFTFRKSIFFKQVLIRNKWTEKGILEWVFILKRFYGYSLSHFVDLFDTWQSISYPIKVTGDRHGCDIIDAKGSKFYINYSTYDYHQIPFYTIGSNCLLPNQSFTYHFMENHTIELDNKTITKEMNNEILRKIKISYSSHSLIMKQKNITLTISIPELDLHDSTQLQSYLFALPLNPYEIDLHRILHYITYITHCISSLTIRLKMAEDIVSELVLTNEKVTYYQFTEKINDEEDRIYRFHYSKTIPEFLSS